MVLDREPQRGGFKRKIQLSMFIRNHLETSLLVGRPDTGHEVYMAYKKAVQSEISPEFRAVCYRRIKASIANARRKKPHQRVKVTREEVESNLQNYIDGKYGVTVGDVTVGWEPHPPRLKRRCISYNGFQHYLYVLRRLKLIEYTGEQALPEPKSGRNPSVWHEDWVEADETGGHYALYIRAVADGLSDPAWQNIWKAYANLRASGS